MGTLTKTSTALPPFWAGLSRVILANSRAISSSARWPELCSKEVRCRSSGYDLGYMRRRPGSGTRYVSPLLRTAGSPVTSLEESIVGSLGSNPQTLPLFQALKKGGRGLGFSPLQSHQPHQLRIVRVVPDHIEKGLVDIHIDPGITELCGTE